MGSAPSQEQKIKYFLGSGYLKKQVTEQITLKMAYFNYGVCSSPFQYQTQDNIGQTSQQIKDLQAIFKTEYQIVTGKAFDQQNLKNNKWEIGKLDALLKKGRYSALYYDDIGIVNNKFLMDKATYQDKWEKQFQIAKKYVQEQYPSKQQLQKHKKNLLQMDFVHYRTLIKYVYRGLNMSFEQIVSTQSCGKYQQYMKQKFQSAVINQKYKIQKLLKRLKKFEVDIFFLQNIDQKLLKIIEKKTSEFRIIKSRFGSSAIIISWKGLKKIVGDSIRPFSYYNKKYLDPSQIYEISPETKSIIDQKQSSNLQFQQNDSRSFKPLDPMMNKNIRKKNQVTTGGVKIQAQKSPELTPQQKKKIQQQQKHLKKQKQIQQKQQQQKKKKEEQKNTQEQQQDEQQSKKQKQQKQLYISPKMLDDLIWNNTTIVQFFGSLILITSNLQISQNPNQQSEQEWMMNSFKDLKQAFPNHTIIAAIGIEKQNIKVPNYFVFPDTNKPTVNKKKTYIQSRVHKSKIPIKKTQDYFVTTVQLSDAKVIDINQNPMEENILLIPNEAHPYDHYILSSTFKCTVKKKVKVLPQN